MDTNLLIMASFFEQAVACWNLTAPLASTEKLWHPAKLENQCKDQHNRVSSQELEGKYKIVWDKNL